MKWNHLLSLTIALSCTAMQPAYAATNVWQDANESYQARAASDVSSVNVMVRQGRRLTANLGQLKTEFLSNDGFVISLPLPDGSMANYQFSRTLVMPDELAVKYPEIQTFAAVDTDNPANKGRFDITPHGFHGMFKHNGKWVFIDPEVRNDDGNYVAYYGSDAQALETRTMDTVLGPSFLTSERAPESSLSKRPLTGGTLRTYRLALSAAAEYTSFHGGKTAALGAIVTLVNRINEVFERDMSIRFVLVANNNDIIFTNRVTDPFDNSSDDAEANADFITSVVDNNDFDISHVLNTDGGGLAQLGGVCQDLNKAIGMTGANQPTGDAFYIDYVAHEIGHQLGANHTFNGTSLACGGRFNRNFSTAWEPGSGSTIMGYAGICGVQDLQANSDPYFHTGSIQQILETASAANCGTVTSTNNAVPTAEAGPDFTIPANMPFKLSGSGTDSDGDALTYIWEQYDTGTSSSSLASMVDNGSRPLFRSINLSSSPDRYFPDLVDYADDNLRVGETMPTTNRDLNFRLTVRDGKGGVATDAMTVTVVAGGETFKVTEPENGSSLEIGSDAFVRWDVAGTDQPPISCSSVDILMSVNGDETFEMTLVENTPNDGEHEFVVGESVTEDTIIMIRCTTSGFYALSAGGVTAVENTDSTNEDEASPTTTTRSNDSGGGFSLDLYFLGFLLFSAIFLRRSKGGFRRDYAMLR